MPNIDIGCQSSALNIETSKDVKKKTDSKLPLSTSESLLYENLVSISEIETKYLNRGLIDNYKEKIKEELEKEYFEKENQLIKENDKGLRRSSRDLIL